MKQVFVLMTVRRDGSVLWEVQDSKGMVIGGGGTRKRTPPKDPIRTACKMVEGALKRACLPGRANPKFKRVPR